MGGREVKVSDHTVLLSLHEVTPAFEDDVVKSCDMLDDLGISSYSLLVVPFYAMKMANSFEKHDLFADYLKSLGLEISLHGYSHHTKSGSPEEFKGLSTERLLSRLKLGVSMFERAFSRRPLGFVPPAWAASQGLVTAMKTVGIRYCVIGSRIYTQESAVVSTSERVISTGTGELPLMNALVELELGGSVQVAVHPHDFHYGRMRDFLTDLEDRLDYTFVGYDEYLSRAIR